MKCEIIIDKDAEEKVVIFAKEETSLIEDIKKLAEEAAKPFLGYKDGEIVKLEFNDIYAFSVIDNKVYAILENDKYLLKERLYLIEEILPTNFIKINQSCIANINKMERFDASISGTLKIRFKNGYVDFVSRRKLKNIKERLGI